MRYPKEKIKNIVSITQLDLNVNVHINGSSDTSDFQ